MLRWARKSNGRNGAHWARGCQVGAAWPAGVLGQGVTAAGWRSSRSTRPGRTGAGECADRVSTVVRAFPQIPLDPRQPPETRPRAPCSLRACGPRAVSASAPGHGPVRRCDTPRTCSVVCAAASLLLPCKTCAMPSSLATVAVVMASVNNNSVTLDDYPELQRYNKQLFNIN